MQIFYILPIFYKNILPRMNFLGSNSKCRSCKNREKGGREVAGDYCILELVIIKKTVAVTVLSLFMFQFLYQGCHQR